MLLPSAEAVEGSSGHATTIARLLVVWLSRAWLTPSEVTSCRSLLIEQGDADWAEVLVQASSHKVAALVAGNLLRYGLLYDLEAADSHFPHGPVLSMLYEGNRARNVVIQREVGEVLTKLHERGIVAVPRKGAVMLGTVYGDIGTRYLGDLDLMIAEADLPAAREVLTGLGYLQGDISRNRRVMSAASRARTLFWRMYVNNLMPFTRYLGPGPVADFDIDICLNRFYPGSGYDLSPASAITSAQPCFVQGAPAFAMTPDEMLIDIVAHLFKEATSLFYVHRSRDLNLIKFCDIAFWIRHIGDALDWDVVVEKSGLYGIAVPMYFGLSHCEALYPGTCPEWVLDTLRPTDLGVLDMYGVADRRPSVWAAAFMDRLFDLRRFADSPPESKEPL